jgi:DNA-binding NtrC family response regulator
LSNATAINYDYLSHQSERQQDGPIDEATLSNHVEVLKDLAQALIREIDRLRNAQLPDVERGVNFYEEVERFEVNLIRSALERTGGHQTRAARLLGINITTLNHKIKRYKIEPDLNH